MLTVSLIVKPLLLPGMAMFICLSVCSSVCGLKRVLAWPSIANGHSAAGPRELRMSQMFIPHEKLSPHEIYASSVGLLMVAIKMPNLLYSFFKLLTLR